MVGITAVVTGVAVFGVMFALVGVQDGLSIPDLIQSDDARLASVEAWYDDQSNRLTVAIYLTDSNGDYTKANGDAKISISQNENLPMVYSDKHNFVKDDFLSWRDNSGNKVTGYRIDIRQSFPSGDYDVFVDLNTKELHLEDLHASFYSQVSISDLIQSDDARLAQVESYYYEDSNRLLVIIILTDSNGDYTKVNGDAEITISRKNLPAGFSEKYNFVKDDFLSWRDNFGNKVTGYRIDIKQFFASGEWDVSVDLNTKSGQWVDLHASFYSLE